VLASDGRVTGVRVRERGGAPVTEQARLVVGADGRHSAVARAVGAAEYDVRPARSCAFYGYWSGVPLTGGEIYARPRRAIGAWPTNDGLTVTFVAAPLDELGAFRDDPVGRLQASLDAAGTLGERTRAGTSVGRVAGTGDLRALHRTAAGPGWALVGDAGLVVHPVTGQGIADALRDAELLAGAVAPPQHHTGARDPAGTAERVAPPPAAPPR
jgi:2-polyprenyl-6-methoxyphenol hydroxylase-like FAD-dependent oxidoreductase